MVDLAVSPSSPNERPFAAWTGFCFAATAIFAITLAGMGKSAATLVLIAYFLGLCAFTASAFAHGKRKLLLVAAAVTLVQLIATHFEVPNTLRIGISAFGVMLICIAMVTAYRVGVLAYLLFALAYGLFVEHNFENWVWAFTSSVTAGLLFSLANYLVQLVFDHDRERRLVGRTYTKKARRAIATPVLRIWLFAFAFAALGLALQWAVQTRVKETIYQTGLIARVPSDLGDDASRDMHADVQYTLEQRKAESRNSFLQEIRNAELRGTPMLAALPGAAGASIEKIRPGRSNAHAMCTGAKSKWGSIRGVCRRVVNAGNDEVQESFTRMRDKVTAATDGKARELEAAGKRSRADVEAAGLLAIDEVYDAEKATARAFFGALYIAALISYLVLVLSLVGALQMIFGRVLFDRTTGLPFGLAGHGRARPIDWSMHDAVDLSSPANDLPLLQTWYVRQSICRIGEGTREDVCLPQPFAALLQRLFSGRLVFTRISTAGASSSKTSPVISLPGDLKLIRIKLQRGQEVAFRMSDLAAFSQGVTIRSIYSTHVAGHLLRLGSFQSYVEGEGYLILASEGVQVQDGTEGLSVPAANLLAWDRAHEFRLEQVVSARGIWLNEPSLVLASPDKCAILDEGRKSTFGVLQRAWMLLRYLVLPF